MLARYFLRVALIFAAVLSMVQPVQASGTVAVGAWWYVSQYVGDTNSFKSTPQLTCQYIKEIYYSDATGWGGYTASVSSVTATTFSCSIKNSSNQYAFSGGGNKGGDVCPSNSIGTTTCTCTDPYIPNAGATACVMPACPANGTSFSSGYYDIGTNPNAGSGLPATSGCDGACSTAYNGDSIGWRVQIGGVYHYFAKGGYFHIGVACSSGSPSVGVLTAIPSVSCSAGQSLVTGSNGFQKCYDDMTGTFVDGNSASAVAAAQTLADAKTAAQIAAAGDAVAAAGGSASDVAAAQSVAAGVAAAAVGAAGTNPDPVQAAFCAENPTASICVASDFGSVDDSALTDQVKNVAITPVSVGGAGSCPAPSVMVLHGHTYYFDWTTYCNFANMIKPVLLAFAWLAAAGILVGGFVA